MIGYLAFCVSSFSNMNYKRIPNMPGAGAASALAKVAVIGGLGLYGALNSLFNVEGGYRAIVFNRIDGIKNKVYYFFVGNCFLSNHSSTSCKYSIMHEMAVYKYFPWSYYLSFCS